MKLFAVIGHPIGHSLSPTLHGKAFSLLGLDCTYEAVDVAPASLASTVRHLVARGFSGFNVTTPLKEEMLKLVDEVSDEASMVGAVNTVSVVNERLIGDNTDVYGVSASLEPFRKDIEGKPVLLLGAGGSARATLFALSHGFRCSEIVVANRTESRARDLSKHFRQLAGGAVINTAPLSNKSLSSIVDRAALVVNTTSVGMSPLIDQSPVGDEIRFCQNQIVMDLIYTPLKTKFLTLASKCGARTISGLEMFLHQGARSFELWLGKQMPIDQIRPIIVDELSSLQKNDSN